MMRKTNLAAAALLTPLLMCATFSNAQASLIDVYQGGNFLGSIESYSGGLSAVDNYNYYSAQNHVISGPSITNQIGHIFFYDGSDGLSFNTVLSSGGVSGEVIDVQWNIAVTSSTTDAAVLLSDDGAELHETATNDQFEARWRYNNFYGDGGVIGEIGGSDWQIEIDPLFYGATNTNAMLTNLFAFDSNGNDINLAINTTENIVFRMSGTVPEPSILALFAAGLIGLSFRKKVITV